MAKTITPAEYEGARRERRAAENPADRKARLAAIAERQDGCDHPKLQRTPYGVCRACGYWFGSYKGFGEAAHRRNLD